MATVKWVLEVVGPSVQLMVDYNQSLDPVEARRRIAAIAEYGIAWVEEPVHEGFGWSRAGPCDLAGTDPDGRELVVSA